MSTLSPPIALSVRQPRRSVSSRVKARAVPAWQGLQAAISAAGRRLACEGDPDSFTSTDPDVIDDARQACGWCLVAAECLAFGRANAERGVWGGKLLGARRGRATAHTPHTHGPSALVSGSSTVSQTGAASE